MGLLRRLLPGFAAVLICGCGGGVRGGGAPLPGPADRVNPIYDVTVQYPSTTLIRGGLQYVGVTIEMEIEFRDATLRDGDPALEAEARVRRVVAGGVEQPHTLDGPLDIRGSLEDARLDTGFFGPIRVGTADLIPLLDGLLQEGGRRVAGSASLFGSSDPGSFLAIKRRRYLVAGSDLLSSAGEVSVWSVRNDSEFSAEDSLETISSDPLARVSDGRPFIVNRYSFDNLQGLDPARGFATAFQYSLGNLANPHDVAALPPGAAGDDPAGAGIAFVTRYGQGYDDLAVLDLAEGTILDRIDLKPYALNPDGTPRPDRAILQDGLLWVTLQDVDRSFTRFMNGRMVAVDPVGRAVVQVIDLAGQNPFESLTFSPATGLLWVGLAGIFPGLQEQALTGGVEAIDPVGRRSLGLVVDDDDLGGNVSAVAVPTADTGFCVVSDASFHNFVKTFDPATGRVIGTLFSTTDLIATIEDDGDGFLLVALRSLYEPRILVFDTRSGALVASLPSRLPPLSIAVLTRSL